MPSVSRLDKACRALGLTMRLGKNEVSDLKNLNKIQFDSEIAAALNLPDKADRASILAAIKKITEENRCQHESAALRRMLEKWLDRYGQPPLKKIFAQEDNSVITSPHPAARPVPAIEYEAAAGGGRINLDAAPQSGSVWFRRDWLDNHGIDPTKCAVIRVAGESMEPTLIAGCSILIDRARIRRKIGYIYVILTDDGLVVKRLGKKDNMWQLLSDNPAWEQIAFPAGSKIIGRVMWTARSLA